MPSIVDELTEGTEVQKQEIFQALRKMAQTLTSPIEHRSNIGSHNIQGNPGRGSYWFSQAAMACFGRYCGFPLQVDSMMYKPMFKVDKLIEAFASTREEDARPGIRLFFYAELGCVMLGKADKYSPALWTRFEPRVLNEIVEWA